jgi:hypothetical protein
MKKFIHGLVAILPIIVTISVIEFTWGFGSLFTTEQPKARLTQISNKTSDSTSGIVKNVQGLFNETAFNLSETISDSVDNVSKTLSFDNNSAKPDTSQNVLSASTSSSSASSTSPSITPTYKAPEIEIKDYSDIETQFNSLSSSIYQALNSLDNKIKDIYTNQNNWIANQIFSSLQADSVVSKSINTETIQTSEPLSHVYGGTGISQIPLQGQLLVGGTSGYTLANLVAGTNIQITQASGSITINSTNNYLTNVEITSPREGQRLFRFLREGLPNLTAGFTLSSTELISVLGYTPLRNTSDTINGNLGISGGLTAGSTSVSSLGVIGNMSAASGNISNTLSVGSLLSSGGLTAGSTSVSSLGVIGNMSAASATVNGRLTFNQLTRFVTGDNVMPSVGSIQFINQGSNSVDTIKHTLAFGTIVSNNVNDQFAWTHNGSYMLVLDAPNGNSDIYSNLDVFGNLRSTAQIGMTFTGAATGTTLVQASNGWFYRTSSSERYKENIVRNYEPENLMNFLGISPIKYDYRNAPAGNTGIVGFSADELYNNGFDSLVNLNEKGQPESLRDTSIIAYHHGILQSLNEKIKKLEETPISSLDFSVEEKIDSLKEMVETLSISIEDGKLVISSDTTISGNLLANNVAITGNLKIGTMSFDSLENSIEVLGPECSSEDSEGSSSCETNKLSLMPNKSGNIEVFGGEIKLTPNGTFTTKKVETNSLKVSPVTELESGSDCDKGEIKIGTVDEKSFIFVCTSENTWKRASLESF